MKAAYQGTRGSYSEVALYKHFGNDAESVCYETPEEVFEAVKKNKVDFGFLPFVLL